jgi:uncharacterized protein (DUF1778 family)
MSKPLAKRDTLNIRIKSSERSLIDRAAQSLGKYADSILDAVRRGGEGALVDHTLLSFSPEVYAEFIARLDAPPQPNRRLRRAMKRTSP